MDFYTRWVFKMRSDSSEVKVNGDAKMDGSSNAFAQAENGFKSKRLKCPLSNFIVLAVHFGQVGPFTCIRDR